MTNWLSEYCGILSFCKINFLLKAEHCTPSDFKVIACKSLVIRCGKLIILYFYVFIQRFLRNKSFKRRNYSFLQRLIDSLESLRKRFKRRNSVVYLALKNKWLQHKNFICQDILEKVFYYIILLTLIYVKIVVGFTSSTHHQPNSKIENNSQSHISLNLRLLFG